MSPIGLGYGKLDLDESLGCDSRFQFFFVLTQPKFDVGPLTFDDNVIACSHWTDMLVISFLHWESNDTHQCLLWVEHNWWHSHWCQNNWCGLKFCQLDKQTSKSSVRQQNKTNATASVCWSNCYSPSMSMHKQVVKKATHRQDNCPMWNQEKAHHADRHHPNHNREGQLRHDCQTEVTKIVHLLADKHLPFLTSMTHILTDGLCHEKNCAGFPMHPFHPLRCRCLHWRKSHSKNPQHIPCLSWGQCGHDVAHCREAPLWKCCTLIMESFISTLPSMCCIGVACNEGVKLIDPKVCGWWWDGATFHKLVHKFYHLPSHSQIQMIYISEKSTSWLSCPILGTFSEVKQPLWWESCGTMLFKSMNYVSCVVPQRKSFMTNPSNESFLW